MSQFGILVDYEWCSGCHTCEIACQMEHGFDTDKFGVRVSELGPWQIEGATWQHANIPLFSLQCNLCSERVAKGKLPTCVSHCQASCLKYDTLDVLFEELKKKPQQFLVNVL